jgi:hypothetical protein
MLCLLSPHYQQMQLYTPENSPKMLNLKRDSRARLDRPEDYHWILIFYRSLKC